jgi:hypothetical protein
MKTKIGRMCVRIWGLCLLLATVWIGGGVSLTLAAPIPPVVAPPYADYDSELREVKPRPDGLYHVDTPRLIAKLVAGKITTYAFLVWHAKSDWDDFRLEFMPAAQKAGLTVWLYLTPPTQPVSYGVYYPYGRDYLTWAKQAAKVAVAYPALNGLIIDDFYENTDFFTPTYVRKMMNAAHAIAPALRFLPVNYDLSIRPANATNNISVAFATAYNGLVDGVIFPYLHWADKNMLSDEATQIAENSAILHGTINEYVINFPSKRASAAGDFAAVSEVIAKPNGFDNSPYPFSFRVSNSYGGSSMGYHLTQVLVDSAVVWQGDTGGSTGPSYVTLNLAAQLKGKSSATITVRLFDLKDVGNFGVLVNWDLPPGTWTISEHGAFIGTSQLFLPPVGLSIPLIVMIYDGGFGGTWFPTPDYVRQANVTAQQAVLGGQAAGIIQYCLDKTDKSQQFPIVSKLYHQWQP